MSNNGFEVFLGRAPDDASLAKLSMGCDPRTAMVALARKLAGILFAMMRDKAAFTPPLPKTAAQAT